MDFSGEERTALALGPRNHVDEDKLWYRMNKVILK
jgi:hypothetical protein